MRSTDFLFPALETGLNRGNMSSHISKLEAAGYLDVLNEIFGVICPHDFNMENDYIICSVFSIKKLTIWNDTL